jgi:alkanesulfonate monooxygenase SsuD/methylene tetrahydromethanopterin reductase-like flavin-dependent oxidoreductase (luciferase family)
MTAADRYGQLWRELKLCDELGFDFGFCVEHHFRRDESWMSAPGLYAVAAGMQTKRIRLGGMGHIVPLHNPLRLCEEIATADQMLNGRLEVGLVPGINPGYFRPFNVDFQKRREVTLEFVEFMKAAFATDGRFSFEGKYHTAKDLSFAVSPAQRPHPPLWIETRDPATLAFCAKHGINAGYFFLFPREDAAPRYREFLRLWQEAGWKRKPNVAYSTVVLPACDTQEQLQALQNEHAKTFEERGEPGAAEIMRHLTDPEYLLEHDLVLIGSPATVTRQLKRYATDGLFDTFFGEFNFGNLAEADLMRSIRLFGTEVMPALRQFEPY